MPVAGVSWNRYAPATDSIKQERFDFMAIGKSTFKSQGGQNWVVARGHF